ncbi:MAG: hypothetical protein ACXWJ1_01850, partial [Caldimonas sp.]
RGSSLLPSALICAPASFELLSFFRFSIERSIVSSRFSAAVLWISVLSALGALVKDGGGRL